jgi:alginate O-acetyltransferase complex protein AlgI
MLFNSIDFTIFLPTVFILYWFVTNRNLNLQNFFIVAASFVFYGWWDWRFLILLSTSAIVDYILAIQIDKTSNYRKKKLFLSLSIITNLGILFFFKYFNFFVENFIVAFQFFGYKFSPITLKIILPIGISFYIFKTLSYTIDVSREKLKPARNIIDYFAFLSFFPQLLAGPIDRATHLLPQFYSKRVFSYPLAVDGLKQILWGLFTKVVIADNCAIIANTIFNNSENYSGSTLLVGTLFFAVQIYADFSGYSDIAIGTSRLFGFDSMRNFAFPYFSRDIIEFWRRWHISLTSWLTDYVFTPLSVKWRNMGNIGTGAALFITFLLCGFWHGANWTFIVWGALNALYFIPFILFKGKKKRTDIVAKGKILPSLNEMAQMGITFLLTAFAWIFFRSDSIEHAMNYISTIFSNSLIAIPDIFVMKKAFGLLFIIIGFFIIEWMGREQQYALQITSIIKKSYMRIICYYIVAAFIIWFGNFGNNQFIYFQF